MLGEQGAERIDVGGFADEREGVEVDADFAADGHVGAVLVGEGREVDLDPGEVDVSAATEGAGLLDLTAETVLLLLEDAELDEAVIDQDDAAHGHGANHLRVIGGDGEDLAVSRGGVIARDIDDLADDELGGLLAGTSTDFRPLDVHHHRELLLHAAADLADAFYGGADPGMVGVGHIEPDHVGPGVDDRFQLGL